jgi:hypothetical protein
MAKRIMWKVLKASIPPAWVKSKHETELSITLVNGSVITLCGANNYNDLRGSGVDFVVFDEFAFMKLEAWKEIIRPALATAKGHALFLSTPDGFNHFYDFYMKGMDILKKAWKSWHFTTLDGGWVDEEEIEEMRNDLDTRTFDQETNASFEASSGRVYYAFSDDNIKKFVPKETESYVYNCGIDFNVTPYIPGAIFVRYGETIHFVDEIIIPNGNTPLLIEEMENRYGKDLVEVFPDPTGKGRSTNVVAGQTDFYLLKEAAIK